MLRRVETLKLPRPGGDAVVQNVSSRFPFWFPNPPAQFYVDGFPPPEPKRNLGGLSCKGIPPCLASVAQDFWPLPSSRWR